MSNSAELTGEPDVRANVPKRRILEGRARRLTGWCGIGMVVAILINGPLSQALKRTPSYWDAGAGENFAAYLRGGSERRSDVGLLRAL